MKIKLLIGAGVALAAAIILAPAVMEKMKPVNPTHNAATAPTQNTSAMTPEEAEAQEEADAASADPDVAQPATMGDSVAPNTTEAEGGEE